jgi:hypothetical protein
MKYYILFLQLISLYGFGQTKLKSEKINIGKGLYLLGEFDTQFSYNRITIYKSTIPIFSDSTHEFVRNSKSFPKVYFFKKNVTSILIESFEAPNKNLLHHYEIKHDKLVKKDILPLFLASSKNLDNDKNLEVAGFWDNFQIKNDSTFSYEPIIFYEFTNDGIRLDKAATIKKNKDIYGKFYGYKINENIIFSSKLIWNKLVAEQKIIKEKD